MGILVGSVVYLLLIPEILYVYALGLILIALVSFTFGMILQNKEGGREPDLESAKYFTRLVEANRDVSEKDLELMFGKFSDIVTPLWIFLLGLVALELPKEIAGIQPFGTTQTYVLTIAGLAVVAFAIAMLVTRSLNPLTLQARFFKDYLAAKEIIRKKNEAPRSSYYFAE